MSTSKKLALTAFAFAAAVLVPLSAFAQGDDKSGSNIFDVRAYASIGAGLAIGLAALGGTLGQGRAAAAALEGISRNPGAAARIQTPMILGLALIESLVIFALLIAFLLNRYGPIAREMIEKRLGFWLMVSAAIILIGIVAVVYLF